MQTDKNVLRSRCWWGLPIIPAVVLAWFLPLDDGVRTLVFVGLGLITASAFHIPLHIAFARQRATISIATKWVAISHYLVLSVLIVLLGATGTASVDATSGLTSYFAPLWFLYLITYIATLIGLDKQDRKQALAIVKTPVRLAQKLIARLRHTPTKTKYQALLKPSNS